MKFVGSAVSRADRVRTSGIVSSGWIVGLCWSVENVTLEKRFAGVSVLVVMFRLIGNSPSQKWCIKVKAFLIIVCTNRFCRLNKACYLHGLVRFLANARPNMKPTISQVT